MVEKRDDKKQGIGIHAYSGDVSNKGNSEICSTNSNGSLEEW